VATAAQWIQGARLRTLPAAIAPVLIGTAAAYEMDAFLPLHAVLAALVALLLQIGVNYANDYSDGIRGTDEDRVGPLRLVGSGAAQPEHVKYAAFTAFGLAMVFGLALIILSQTWWLILVGIGCILAAWGYVDGWELTDAGEQLARLYTETDLLLAEALRAGLLDGLRPPELAALVSCFTYEKRGPDDARGAAHMRWPSNAVSKAVRAIERRWRDLNAAEDDHRLPATRTVDPGFVETMFEWARGDALALVLDDELSAGDFVRQVKQCVDVLRQIADVDPDPAVATTARDAARACLRGVVAAASAVGT